MITPQPGGSLYRALAGLLRKEIVTGRLKPGQRLPSERTLMQEHGVSRETVRRATALLRAESLVVVRQGHGARVREQPELEDLVPPAGATVTARVPSEQERLEYDIPEGVAAFWVVSPDGTAELFPADRWRLRWPASGDTPE
ncbi:GntR family transcriptional regulator [Paractinoplanes toevensis]|uniref:HTH gntR-type domain-containing protein n=1 Tax=Paractinoplanes toevensis TaxID=571911 RepID=A0A919T6D3_9ACTN|nr:winged helix-turn-helix domain-containing protein [Actinoplanes toevensis]GIM89713.1 hypothetical protein Ato02nite_015060 [Actinoplanes toevensis]